MLLCYPQVAAAVGAVGEEDMVVKVVVVGITGYKEVCFMFIIDESELSRKRIKLRMKTKLLVVVLRVFSLFGGRQANL